MKKKLILLSLVLFTLVGVNQLEAAPKDKKVKIKKMKKPKKQKKASTPKAKTHRDGKRGSSCGCKG